MFPILLFGVILLLVYFYQTITKKQSYWQEKGVTTLTPKFLVGNTFGFFGREPFPFMLRKHYMKFPNDRYVGNYNFVEPTLIIRDPELIKEVLIKSFDHFMDHRVFADYKVDKFWGKNLITSQGERWRDMRATLSPSFTGSKMRIMFGLMEECAQQFVGHLKSNKLTEINTKENFSRFTNDVIGTTAFGLQVNSFKNPKNDFFIAGQEAPNFGSPNRILRILTYMLSPTLGKLLKIKIIPERLEKYFTGIIEETLRVRKENKVYRPDMIQLLLEAQDKNNRGEITIEDISSHAFLFFLAGFETVSTFLTFFFYELILNPEVQDKLRKELQSIDGKITYDNLLKLKYLEMVCCEVLRKWPPASFAERLCTKEFVIEPVLPHEKRLVVEKGIDCMVPITGLHYDPKYFPEPEKFDPERFSDENKHKINPAVYIPFGAGPRICIGNRFAMQEAKLLIYYILTNFEVVPTEKTQIPIELDTKQVNLAPKNGLWVGFKPLEH